jgi:hypothetical protein
LRELWQADPATHDGHMTIQRGTAVDVRTATGAHVRMRAMSAPVRGRDFPVVWVCTDEEYQSALNGGQEPDGIPWPLDAVQVLEPA